MRKTIFVAVTISINLFEKIGLKVLKSLLMNILKISLLLCLFFGQINIHAQDRKITKLQGKFSIDYESPIEGPPLPPPIDLDSYTVCKKKYNIPFSERMTIFPYDKRYNVYLSDADKLNCIYCCDIEEEPGIYKCDSNWTEPILNKQNKIVRIEQIYNLGGHCIKLDMIQLDSLTNLLYNIAMKDNRYTISGAVKLPFIPNTIYFFVKMEL